MQIITSTTLVSESDRLGMIQELSNRMITREEDAEKMVAHLKRLYEESDHAADTYENDDEFRFVGNRLETALKDCDLEVFTYRFGYSTQKSSVFGYTMLVAQPSMEDDGFKEKAVIHLVAHQGQYYHSTNLKYKIPSRSSLVPFNSNPNKKIEARLRSLGFDVQFNAKSKPLKYYIESISEKNNTKFVDLNAEASYNIATRVSSQLSKSWPDVSILKEHNLYTVVARR